MQEDLLQYLSRFTSIELSELSEIIDKIPIHTFCKGTVVIRQGEVPQEFYFVLEGCVRKYFYDKDGKETTVEFYTENQLISLPKTVSKDEPSKYSLACVEDCVLIVGDNRPNMNYTKYSPN